MRYQDVILRSRPASFFRLDERAGTVARNLVGSGDGAYVNAPVLGGRGALLGDLGGAVDFTRASTQEVTIPSGARLNPNSDFAIAAWINPDDDNSGNVIWGCYAGSGNPYWMFVNRTDANALNFQYDLGAAAVFVFSGTTKVALGDGWVQVAVARVGNAWTLYKNGSVHATATNTVSTLLTTTTAQSIATMPGFGSGNWFDGQLDEVVAYGRGLSSAEVLRHYRAGRGQFARTTRRLGRAA